MEDLLAMMFAAGPSGPTFATWNPADKGAAVTLSNGNLTADGAGADAVRSTIGKTTGKWFWETTITSGSGYCSGVGYPLATLANFVGSDAYGLGVLFNGSVYSGGSIVGATTGYGAGSVLGFALDADAKTLGFYILGTLYATVTVPTQAGSIYAMVTVGNGNTETANFGASPFAYSVPSGYNPGLYE